MVHAIVLGLVVALISLAHPVWAKDITAVSCDRDSVQTAVDAAVDGDRVLVPSGRCTWTTYVTVGKAIKLTGAGIPGDIGAATTGGTTIVANTSDIAVLHLSEATSGRIDVSNLTFVFTSASLNPGFGLILIDMTIGGQPVLLHHNTFSLDRPSGNALFVGTMRGVIYRNLFQNTPPTSANNFNNATAAIRCKMRADLAAESWAAPSTIGTADTTGQKNLYFETNTIRYFTTEAHDFDDGCRIVFRYNTFDNSSGGSHGFEGSPVGARHYEVYNNTYFCSVAGNIQQWFGIRGGTGVIADNIMPIIGLTCALSSNHPSMTGQIQLLRRYSTCWLGGYPFPHQPGWGWIQGSNQPISDGTIQALEPMYIWNNKTSVGGASADNLVPVDYSPIGCTNTTTPDSTLDYVKLNREYYYSAKPGYQKYPYPHPLTSGAPIAPSGLSVK